MDQDSPVEYLKDHSEEIIAHVGDYGGLIGDALFLLALGMVAVFLLHRLASGYIYGLVKNSRLVRVAFGTLYVLVLVLTVLLVVKEIGFDVSRLGQLAIVTVMVLAVLVYFLVPFLPKLPFLPGHMIETNGVLGVVDSISSFHTTLRKFDGTMVFLPNAMVVASRISNFSYLPNRRIEITLGVAADADFPAVRVALAERVGAHGKVLADPAPAVHVVGGDASGLQMTIYCWVANDDFLGTRSELWLDLMAMARDEAAFRLSLPQQEIHLPQPTET